MIDIESLESAVNQNDTRKWNKLSAIKRGLIGAGVGLATLTTAVVGGKMLQQNFENPEPYDLTITVDKDARNSKENQNLVDRWQEKALEKLNGSIELLDTEEIIDNFTIYEGKTQGEILRAKQNEGFIFGTTYPGFFPDSTNPIPTFKIVVDTTIPKGVIIDGENMVSPKTGDIIKAYRYVMFDCNQAGTKIKDAQGEELDKTKNNGVCVIPLNNIENPHVQPHQ